jgi:peptidoglycan/LPS O-acetylase OafA/YrhL
MPVFHRILGRFRRVSTTGTYLAEIDGLRFVAIGAVILVHIYGTWIVNMDRAYGAMSAFDRLLGQMILLGVYGVNLFFMISGFVLAIPFCGHAFSGERPVSLKRYFWRRITRLEPPYLLSMLLFFCMMPLWGKSDYGKLLPNLGASLIYAHNAIFGKGSLINNNAWSLEVEIQFYLLVPLILMLLFCRAVVRRSVLIGCVLLFSAHSRWLPPAFPKSVLQYFQYFLLGILFCDLWTNEWRRNPSQKKLMDLPGIAAWPLFFAANLGIGGLAADFLNPWIIALFFFSALRGRGHGTVLRWGAVPVIGGMCYSIYLLHARIVSLVLRGVFGHLDMTGCFALDFLLLSAAVLPIVVLLSGVYFLLVERPCMDPAWPRKLLNVLLKRTSVRSLPTSVARESKP